VLTLVGATPHPATLIRKLQSCKALNPSVPQQPQSKPQAPPTLTAQRRHQCVLLLDVTHVPPPHPGAGLAAAVQYCSVHVTRRLPPSHQVQQGGFAAAAGSELRGWGLRAGSGSFRGCLIGREGCLRVTQGNHQLVFREQAGGRAGRQAGRQAGRRASSRHSRWHRVTRSQTAR